MGTFSVDPAELGRGDALLAEASAHSRAALAQLAAEADELLGSWRGSAGVAFRLAWEQWLDGATGMLDALDAMVTALGAAATGYAGTEDAVRIGLVRS